MTHIATNTIQETATETQFHHNEYGRLVDDDAEQRHQILVLVRAHQTRLRQE